MSKNRWSKQIGFSVSLAVITLLILLSMIILSRDTRVSAAQQDTIITLIPPNQAYTGELITVKLVVNNADNLAGYQATVRHGNSDLHLSEAIAEEGLSLSGRDMIPLAPVWQEDAVGLGAATCPVADCSDSQYDSAPRYLQGANGYVELARLEFITSTPGQYNLTLENVQLVDPQGNQLGATPTNIVLEVNTR